MYIVVLKPINLLYSNVSEDYPEWDSASTYMKGDKVKVTKDTSGNLIFPPKFFESVIDNNTGNYPPDNTWNFVLHSRFPEWDKNASYNVGDIVKVSYESDMITPFTYHPLLFKSLTSSNQGNYPPSDSTNWQAITLWKETEAPERWKMFDSYIQTYTETTDTLEVVLSFADCNMFYLANIEAISLEWKLYDGDYTDESNLVLSGNIDNLQYPVSDWYSYFYEPITYRKDVYISNLPIYSNGQLKITLTKLGSVKCGLLFIGRDKEFGDTSFDARVSIDDYSIKEVNTYGYTRIEKRAYSKLIEADFWLYTKQVDILQDFLSSIRSTLCIFNFNNTRDYTKQDRSLIVYGFYKNFEITYSSSVMSRCTMQIEGII